MQDTPVCLRHTLHTNHRKLIIMLIVVIVVKIIIINKIITKITMTNC